jgi:hypothetical protein
MAGFFALFGGGPAALAETIDVTTYHYDNLRTGWDEHETKLTAATVADGFGLLTAVTLDGQVDAQPLLVTQQALHLAKPHDVVYVATENNTVYAIDATSGRIYLQKTLGSPVPMSQLPGQCNNNAPVVGIDATPVIDKAKGLLYVIADTYEKGNAVYRLHALALDTLADAIPPVVISASHPLARGGSYSFAPGVSRVRAGLVEANGNVYAAFASYCDAAANVSRGWVLGWNATTLTPLPNVELTDQLDSSPYDFFLSSIWMSGFGLAADQSGYLYFVTGNTDPSGTQYHRPTNLAESVVKLSGDLTRVASYFTPANWAQLDQSDGDFGSGGVTLLPALPGTIPHLAVAAGKDGTMYLMNRDSLGGYTPGGPDKVLGSFQIGGCWCGETYFMSHDGLPEIVASGGSNISLFSIQTGTSPPSLNYIGSSTALSTGQDPGFLTVVSSRGTAAGSAIVWAVARPTQYSPADVLLYAIDPTNGNQLYAGVAGTWPNVYGNANIMPVVANGKVYVASYAQLAIFGLGGTGTAARPTAPAVTAKLSVHAITGWVRSVEGGKLVVETRDGTHRDIDAASAMAAHHAAIPLQDKPLLIRGDYDAAGMLHATAILRAKDSPALWEADR